MKLYKRTVQINNGNISISLPDIPNGSLVEIIIGVPEESQMQVQNSTEIKSKNLFDLFGKGKGCFSNIAEVDTFLRKERDEWI